MSCFVRTLEGTNLCKLQSIHWLHLKISWRVVIQTSCNVSSLSLYQILLNRSWGIATVRLHIRQYPAMSMRCLGLLEHQKELASFVLWNLDTSVYLLLLLSILRSQTQAFHIHGLHSIGSPKFAPRLFKNTYLRNLQNARQIWTGKDGLVWPLLLWPCINFPYLYCFVPMENHFQVQRCKPSLFLVVFLHIYLEALLNWELTR